MEYSKTKYPKPVIYYFTSQLLSSPPLIQKIIQNEIFFLIVKFKRQGRIYV